MTRALSAWAVAGILASSACSDPGDAGDGGAADGGPDMVVAALPGPPMLTPCPPGWREIVAEGHTTNCEPWPEAGRLDCGPGEAHLPGQPGCAPLGRPCPAGDFPDPLPTDRPILHATADSTGGDGTAASPMPLRDAVTRATTGTVVAMAKGEYDQVVAIPGGVTVQGACAAETVLRSSLASGSDAIVTPRAAGAELRDVTLASSPRLGVRTGGSATIHLAGVVIEGADAAAILVLGGAVTADGLVVRDTRSRADRTFGRALTVQEPGTASVRRALLERNRDYAVAVVGAAASVTLEETVVRDTLPLEFDSTAGGGLLVGQSGTADVRTSVFEENRFATVGIIDEGSVVSLQDVVIRDTGPTELTRENGRGILTQAGGRIDGRRLLVERSRDVGIYLRSGPASLEDAVVRDTVPDEAASEWGHGLSVNYRASLTARRVAFEGNHKSGIFVGDEGATADLEDLTVRDTVGVPIVPTVSSGLMVVEGATVSVSRALFERNAQMGISTGGTLPSTVTMADITVNDSQSDPVNGRLGRGMHVQGAVEVDAVRVSFSRNRGAGMSVGDGATLRLEDASIRDTLERPCTAEGTCASGAFGLMAYFGGHLRVERFLVDGSPLCGIMLTEDGQVDLSQGEVRHHAIGACIQVPDYEVSRLTREVRYLDNDVNLENTELPIPDSGLILGRVDP